MGDIDVDPYYARIQTSKRLEREAKCKPRKGQVCVHKSIAKVGSKLRKGCKRVKGEKNVYVCSKKAAEAGATGAGLPTRSVPKGMKRVSFAKALKKGCRIHKGRPVCPK
jgi:hypothetical protein